MVISKDILKTYNINNPPLTQLCRKKEIQQKYDIYNSNNQNKKKFIEKVKNELKINNFYFHVNDFPYYTEDNIVHYLVWYSDEQYLLEFVKNNKNILTYWVNNKNNSSIKEIKHAHIFI
jgi:hypothetical protein